MDVNDNAPEFVGRPYSVVLPENTKPGTQIYSNISVMDADAAQNAEIVISCVSGGCDTFAISTEKVSIWYHVHLQKKMFFLCEMQVHLN